MIRALPPYGATALCRNALRKGAENHCVERGTSRLIFSSGTEWHLAKEDS